jgi:multidrug transporter EmrE-like cation transporter
VFIVEMSTLDITLISLSEIVGDFGFKNVARTGSLTGWIGGLGGYVGVIYYLIRSLRVGNVMYVNGMWDGISAILETIVAFILFGERLNSWTQYLGLTLIIVGLFTLKSGGIAHN